MQKDIKKRMERELYQYYSNKKLLNRIKRESKDISTRRFLYLEQRITYIENVIASLNDFEKKMFDIIYKDKADCTYCQTYHNISKSTYYNIINKCIFLLAKEWGEV